MLSHLSATLAVAYVLVFVVMQSSATSPDHLVVLSHGLHGGRHDLTYLAKGLEEKGCIVLRSSASEFLESHKGVREGGTRLAMEVLEAREQFPSLSKVSFVGNSLGGLYCRYAIKELYDKESGRIGDLQPQYFMTIASPHLGVRNNTLFDEFNIPLPTAGREMIAKALGATGYDLFVHDPNVLETESLVYTMATDAAFLEPLRAFQKRRLYANLDMDIMVPLGTAAFVERDRIEVLREQYRDRYGIVHIETTASDRDGDVVTVCTAVESADSDARTCQQAGAQLLPSDRMRLSLDGCGWEKVLVSFKALFGVLPMAHNQIAAVTKFGTLIDGILGFHEGRHVMRDAADWLTTIG